MRAISFIYILGYMPQKNYSILSKELSGNRREFAVYTHSPQGTLFRINIPYDHFTVSQCIPIAIQQFNTVHSLSLSEQVNKFKLYAANPNGTRIKEYPSLDQEQQLMLINLGQFYLKQRNNKPKKSKGLKQTIQLGFQIENKKPERRAGRAFGCSCFGL